MPSHLGSLSNLADLAVVSVEGAAVRFDAVDVVSVTRDDLDDKFVCNEIFPKGCSGRLSIIDSQEGLAHVDLGGVYETSDLDGLLSMGRGNKDWLSCTVRSLIPFTLSWADAVISAMGGYGPGGPRGPAPLLPLPPSAPGPGAPFGYPFMACEVRVPGGGKGAAALITAAYAQRTRRMVGGMRDPRRYVVGRGGERGWAWPSERAQDGSLQGDRRSSR